MFKVKYIIHYGAEDEIIKAETEDFIGKPEANGEIAMIWSSDDELLEELKRFYNEYNDQVYFDRVLDNLDETGYINFPMYQKIRSYTLKD